MDLIFQPLSFLISLAIFLLFIMTLLAPFEALGWWAGWTKQTLQPPDLKPLKRVSEPEADYYIVYLTAIGGISAEDISHRERRFLGRLEEALPGDVVMQPGIRRRQKARSRSSIQDQ